MARDPTSIPPGLEDEGTGYGERDGPESQGEYAGEGFGRAARGEFGDEDFDPSYEPPLDPPPDVAIAGTPPQPRSDDNILEDMLELLDNAFGMDPSEIAVRVVDATVILQGLVDSDVRRDAIERYATRIPGVCAVENNLTVRDTD